MSDDGSGVIHVRHGKGNKTRSLPAELSLLVLIEGYLDSRAKRFPPTGQRRHSRGLAAYGPRAPLLVGRDGARITHSTVQSRMRRAFRLAGGSAAQPAGALVHSLRHTFATQLAEAEVPVYTLMKLLGHNSIATTQRYVEAAGGQARAAPVCQGELSPLVHSKLA